ncbi:Arc family DNA-binding protein [Pseudomonas fluorescens]|uniref:Arc family DNA-binding protein n=1 Tax=Pseudomonas fluorescens TaxID=294 RepID=UPI001CD27F08|nr:Arc family DNA-binding protein [Pseudomonas fluorescens]
MNARTESLFNIIAPWKPMTDRHVLPPYSLRMTAELRDQLEASAGQAKRSLNAEIVARLEESFARDTVAQPLSEHDAAMQVLARMYQETLDKISDLKSMSNLSHMDQVELLHEEATAKYLRHAAARAAMPPEERPPQRKQSMPLGIDSDVHLATRVAENTHPPRSKK